ncbi:hypothetical protein HY029_06380 [Candidatus Gottesmanbacteria bacterium]|nr:hypothetical protein [Candidatus Gottesmanbacteria bacterium]
MKNNKENKNLLYAILIGAAIIIGVLAVRQKTNLLPNAQNPSQSYQKIESNNDLTQAAGELDKETFGTLDEGLSQNDGDSSSF